MKRPFNKFSAVAIVALVCLGAFLWHALHNIHQPLHDLDFTMLGGAIAFYEDDHPGQLPPDFHALVKAGLLDEVRAKRIEAGTEFLMANRSRKGLAPKTVIVAERPDRGKPMRMILLLDGTGLSVSSDELSAALADRSATIVLVTQSDGRLRLERR